MNYLKKYFHSSYFSSVLILCLDIAASVFATLLTFLLVELYLLPNKMDMTITIWWFSGSLLFSCIFFIAFKVHKAIIRYTTLYTLGRLILAVLFKFIALFLLFYILPFIEVSNRLKIILFVDMLFTFTILMAMRISMVVLYSYIHLRYIKKDDTNKILVYGTGPKSVAVITRLLNSSRYKVVGFLHGGKKRNDYRISGLPVFYFQDLQSFEKIKKCYGISCILFTTDGEARAEQDRLIKYGIANKLKMLIVPSIDEVVAGQLMKRNIREIKIEDLLGRDEIKINFKEIKNSLAGKVIMVTGAAGSIGSELCRQLSKFDIKRLILFDNAETPMHSLRLELEERFPELDFIPIIGDVRLKPRLDYAFREFNPQVVFHAAAYKHVPLMEENPCEAVLVNVIGSRNVADKCLEYNVEKMIMISTDKAVNPTNIMGCSKRLAEIYVQALGIVVEQGKLPGMTKFITTRFGNVLGSNGSVIPRFREQIAKGGPITITHPEITRFFMTIPEACRLVLEAGTIPQNNRIFLFEMGESVKIEHLARRMIDLAGLVPDVDIEIKYTGLRPGEKLYEEVLANKENTLPTYHDRIKIAKVRECDFPMIQEAITELERLSRAVNIDEMVILMKKIVPEFKSQNSRFEAFDK